MAEKEKQETTENGEQAETEVKVTATEAPEGTDSTPAAESEALATEPVADAAASGGEAVTKPKSKAKKKAPLQVAPTPAERSARRLEVRAKKAAARKTYREKLKAKRLQARAAQPVVVTEAVAETEATGRPKVRQGIVLSNKADKTITVRVDVAKPHRRYHKIVRSSTTLHAHDATNDAHEGDVVRVKECRPLSRSKRWRLIDIVERAK